MQTFIASAVQCPRGSEHGDKSACRYQIAWAINPHMQVGASSITRASAQHANLLRTVRAQGAQVIQLPFVHHAFDSVFAKDNAFYAHTDDCRVVVIGRTRYDERSREQAARAHELARRGFDIRVVDVTLEGGDVIALPDRKGILLGHGFRSAPAAAKMLEKHLGVPVYPLELIDPELFHLDVAMHVLSDGTTLACTTAFAPAALATLRRALRGDIVHVDRAEAVKFAVNVVEIGDVVVSGTASRSLADELAARGKSLVVTPLDEFQRAGGSAACLLGPVADLRSAQVRRNEAATTAIRSTAA